jgi:uncharacterized protein (TIGR04551 family)
MKKGGSMRIPLLTLLAVGILVFAAPFAAVAQEEPADESSQDEGKGERKKAEEKQPEEKQPAPKGTPEGKEKPAPPAPLPPAGDQMAPLEPPKGDDLMGGGLPPPPPGFKEVTMDDATAAKPPLNVLDLHGYLRLRGDLMNGLHLGLSAREFYPQFPKSATRKEETLAGANMRFRLEPTINISEDVRIMAQVDMLDNLILGSTPDGYPKNAYYPLVAFSQGQIPPSDGFNALKDSIQVKRVWGEVMTPVGLLRFGRMGSHWGLGILANDGGPAHFDRGPLVTQPDPFGATGQCFDCDYGSTADRIMFITKIFGHYVVPMIDFTSEGPYSNRPNEVMGQPYDLDQLDDVNSWIIAVARRDKPEDIKRALENDEWVLNYGLYFVFRNQAYDAIKFQIQDPSQGPLQSIEDYAIREAEAYIPDVWVRFMWQKLRVELELVMIAGKIGYDALDHNLDEDGNLVASLAGEQVDIFQLGGVLQADYSMLNDSLILGLELGFASGDNSPYFGVRPFDEKQYDHSRGDHDVENFRFNLDYHVDLILWRQIIGTVTDAMYVKPTLQYNIAEGLGTKVSAIYSSAVYKNSTRGKAHPLGLEFDIDFFYFSSDKFHAGLSYGILIPFSGMTDLGDDMLPGDDGRDFNKDHDADIAHRILCRFVLNF